MSITVKEHKLISIETPHDYLHFPYTYKDELIKNIDNYLEGKPSNVRKGLREGYVVIYYLNQWMFLEEEKLDKLKELVESV